MVAYLSFTSYQSLVAKGPGIQIFGSRFNDPEVQDDEAVAIDPLFAELDEVTNGPCQAWHDDTSQQ